MTDRRLERLRQIDAAALRAPWRQVSFDGSPAAARVIATARNILPATIELLELVLTDRINYPPNLGRELAIEKAALAVLDRIGDADEAG